MIIHTVLLALLATQCKAKSSSSSEEDLEKMSELFGTMSGIMGGAMDRIEELDSKKETVELNPFDFLRHTLMKILPPSVSSKVREVTPKITVQSTKRTFSPFADIFEMGDSSSDDLKQLHGPHICTKEYNNKLKKEEAGSGCEKFDGAVRCISNKQTKEGILQTVRIQECCSGFGTTNIVKYGCNMETKVETLKDFLEARNASKFPKNIPTPFTALVSDENPDETTVFNRKIMDYDLFDGTVLTSADNGRFIVHQKKSSKTISYLNCVALKETNRIVGDGIVMTSSVRVSPAAETVMELLEKDGRFKTFISTLSDSAKEKLTSKNSSVTVMPFTDEFYDSFPKSLKDQITSKQKCATTVIEKSHMFQPATCSNDLRSADSLATFFFSVGKVVRIGDAQIVESDLVALNGIVHVVDDVIIRDEIKPWEEKMNATDPEMAALFGGIVEDHQPVTILMPVKSIANNMSKDEAMNQMIPWFLPKLNALPPTVTTIGNSTIFAGKFDQHRFSGTTIEFTFPRSAAKNRRKPAEPVFQIGCSRFTVHPVTKASQLNACGSSVFFIDKPLPIVSYTMTEFLQSREDLSRFASLLDLYTLNNTLPRVSTLFVPVDDAFAVNHFRKLKHDEPATTRFIKSVLVSRPICEYNLNPCSNEIRREVITNNNGDTLHVINEDDEVYVEGSRILESVVVSNGVVHLMENIVTRRESSSINRHLSISPFDDMFSSMGN